jgi:hypothetical protein
MAVLPIDSSFAFLSWRTLQVAVTQLDPNFVLVRVVLVMVSGVAAVKHDYYLEVLLVVVAVQQHHTSHRRPFLVPILPRDL